MIIIILITVTYNIITMVTNIITEVHYTGKNKKHILTKVYYTAKTKTKNDNKKHLLTKVHGTTSPDGQSLGVGDAAVRIEPNEPVSFSLKQMNLFFIDQVEPVWRGHLVQIALLPVHKHRVRPPDLRERFPVERDLSDSARVELESRVRPRLSEVTVQAVDLGRQGH